jgi:hypothetical protein
MLPPDMGMAGLLLLTFRTLQAGSYASQSLTVPQLIVARDAITLHNAWNAYVRQDEPPAIDFKKETAVFLFAGRKNTGGYSIEVKSVKTSGKQIVIDAAIKPPPPDSLSTQVFTSPFIVIAIEKPNVTSVRWMDGKKAIK